MRPLLLDCRKVEDFGIGTYLSFIFQGLVDSGSFSGRLIHLKGTRRLRAPGTSFLETGVPNYDPREHVVIPHLCAPFRDHLFFSPHYLYPYFLSQPLIVTVHDLIHFRLSHLFPPWKVAMARPFLKRIRQRAQVIFTGSETTRRDLEELFSIPRERVRVVADGVEEELFTLPPFEPPPADFPYLLYVGNTKRHKNVGLLLEAFPTVLSRFPDLRLVVVGGPESEDLLSLKREWNLSSRVVYTGPLERRELFRWIDHALLFLFPSLYEGFGLPPLEAMARRVPTLSSPGGSLKEVLGDGVLFFDPLEAGELAEKVLHLLLHPGERERLAQRGYERASSFTWKGSVDSYLRELEKL